MSDSSKKWTAKRYVIFSVLCFLLPFVLSFIGGLFNNMGLDAVHRIIENTASISLLICPLIVIIANIIGLKKNPGNKTIFVVLLVIFGILLLIVLPVALGGIAMVFESISDFFSRIFYFKID